MKRIQIHKQTTRGWILFALYTLLLALFSIWVRSAWPFVIGFPLLFDGYFTKLIRWRWWEKSRSKALKSTMKLVEDLVVVVLLVHFLNIFIFQQFRIPTPSLEKTYLVGDFLFVSKLTYGPRLPMTPLALPLVHNTVPHLGWKAYSDKPQWSYRRAPGLGKVKRYDIVVFNFPAGDTVALKSPNPDYHTQVHMYGRAHIHNNPEIFGKVVYRPVDMRDHYVKRAVGLPGDMLEVKDNALYINGQKQADPEMMQLNYFVQTDGAHFSSTDLDKIGISASDRMILPGNSSDYLNLFAYLGLDTIATKHYGLVYHFPLTKQMRKTLSKHPHVKQIVVEPDIDEKSFPTYPVGGTYGWTRDNYGPIHIPKKGETITLDTLNLPIYERCIRNYEGHELSVEKDGRILIDGEEKTSYTFALDYYFMMGDNRHNSLDSRSWGFVPEDHIVGTPLFVWLSIDKDKPLFKGGIRWRRFFSHPK